MEKLDSALCQWIVIYSLFQFSIFFINFTNRRLPQKLKLIFKFIPIKRQINVPPWTHMEHTGWRKHGRTFTRCFALNRGDEFNANFVLLYFLFCRSIKIGHLYLKNAEKNKLVHLRLFFTYLYQNLFSIKKHLVLVLTKFAHVVFCVFQANLNKGVKIFCKLPD